MAIQSFNSPQIVRKLLLGWYRSKGRKLPWRETRDPYAIWVSEIMLQQTQVDRVIPYFSRFMSRFPDVQTLARANWRELLPYWRGLGYYSRGKNLLVAAKVVVKEYGGDLPTTAAELRQLPGIGSYTAAAISSFAYNRPVPAIDTNLRRVISRVYSCSASEVDTQAELLFRNSRTSSGKLNHALMDVGAIFCKSRITHCESCPLKQACPFASLAESQNVLSLPRRVVSGRPAVQVGAACIHRKGEFLIAERLGGIWEFPGGKKEPGEDIRACLKREIREELGVEISVRPPFLTKDFEKNGKLHRLYFCRSQILRGRPRARVHQSLQWVPLGTLSEYRFAETNKGAVQELQKKRRGKENG